MSSEGKQKKQLRRGESVIVRIIRDVHEHLEQWFPQLMQRPGLRKSMKNLLFCGTLYFGAREYRCDACHFTKYHPLPCKSRACPKCAYAYKLRWIDRLGSFYLPVDHFFLTFTIPHQYNVLYTLNHKLFLKAMFQAITQTLKQYGRYQGADPRKLSKAQKEALKAKAFLPGMVGFFHPFGSRLNLHPHFHILMTPGGISLSDGKTWMRLKFMPAPYLRKVFKTKFQNKLRQLINKGQMKLPADAAWEDPYQRSFLMNKVFKYDWYQHVADREKQFGVLSPVNYVARYLHRFPISPRSIRRYDGKTVSFVTKRRSWETKDDQRYKPIETMLVKDFVERLLVLHPDKSERHIFYSGLYAPHERSRKYVHARKHIIAKDHPTLNQEAGVARAMTATTFRDMARFNLSDPDQPGYSCDPHRCPHCHKTMIVSKSTMFFSPTFQRTHRLTDDFQIVPISPDSS